MSHTDYKKMYDKIFRILSDLTPLRADCGQLCDHACCKGDSKTGMRLFPHEESVLGVSVTESGDRLAVCDGTCDRTKRPLACRIFPFFPTIDERGRIYVEADTRGALLCPIVTHMDEVVFDKRFLRAVRRVGRILAKDRECREFLINATQEIDTYRAFLSEE